VAFKIKYYVSTAAAFFYAATNDYEISANHWKGPLSYYLSQYITYEKNGNGKNQGIE